MICILNVSSGFHSFPLAPKARPRVLEVHNVTDVCTAEPQLDVLATIVIDCVGDCVLPRLTVDKKGNPDVEEFPAQNKDGRNGKC